MGLRMISLFVVLFIGANAHTIKDGDDHYEHMLELITDLQSTVINLEGVVCKQTTELEHMEEKVEKLESTVTNLESNETNLESTVTNLQSSVTNLESTVTNLESTVTNLESTATNLESTETILQTTVTNLEVVVSKQNTELEDMEEKVEKLEEKQLEMEGFYPLLATSCKSVSQLGYKDGVYNITVNNSPLQVYCQDGWTVIQKRYDGSLDYNRIFSQYAHGFGSTAAEHWIGLNHMHDLTSIGNWTLRFDLTAFNGETAWAEYDDFRIDPGTDFTLWFDQSSYRGTAGNSLDYHHGHKFTTRDVDQDDSSGNCADSYGGGGWWFRSPCLQSLTTGMPYGGHAIYWFHWKGYEVLTSATMKIIPN